MRHPIYGFGTVEREGDVVVGASVAMPEGWSVEPSLQVRLRAQLDDQARG